MALTPTFYIREKGKAWHHSLDDYKWAVEDLINVGEPEMEEHNIQIPFGKEYNLSSTMFGFPFFTTRELSFSIGVPLNNLAGLAPNNSWNEYTSNLRNLYEGKEVEIILSDDMEWYYEGTAHITDFEASRKLGTFKLNVHCSAYKQNMTETITQVEAQSTTTEQIEVQLPDSPYPAEVSMYFSQASGTQTFTSQTYLEWKINGKTYSHTFPANSGLTGVTLPLLFSRSDNYGISGTLNLRGEWGSDIIFLIRKRSL